MKFYDINVYRDGKWWMVEIPEVDGLTQARRLADVREMAASYIALALDLPLSDVGVSVAGLRIADVDVSSAMDEVVQLRTQAKTAEERAGEVMRKTAWRLTEEGVPARDIGHILGVSHQRVSQLVNE